jgi:asparagine synthase (glutamine-hydrolysing)
VSGLAAAVSYRGRRIGNDDLARMTATVSYRGNAQFKVGASGAAGLASLGGSSIFEDGSLMVSFDGRLDDQLALAGRLGLDPVPASPAALAASAYRRWGTGAAEQLSGEYAFVLWDETHRRLYAARDVMGARPLFYQNSATGLVAGTEVKQLLAVAGRPVAVNQRALAGYVIGYPGPLEWTFHQGVDRLPPGFSLVADESGLRTWRHTILDPPPVRYRLPGDYGVHLLELLESAMTARIDREPAGIMLSGGLDSGAVAAVAARAGANVTAFTWAFDELTVCDERHISHRVASEAGIPVHGVPADDAWPLSDYRPGASDPDSPFTASPYQALHEVSLRMAHAAGLSRMIWGTSGDLVVGSVDDHYLSLLFGGHWRRLWSDLQALAVATGAPSTRLLWSRLAAPAAGRLWPPHRARPARRLAWRLQRRLRGAAPPWPAWIRSEAARRLDLEGVIEATVPFIPRGGAFGRRYDALFHHWQLLGREWIDRTHARSGMVYLDPWGDRQLAEYALAVPAKVLSHPPRTPSKPLLRTALRSLLSAELVAAAGKTVPSPLYDRGVNQQERATVRRLLTAPLLADLGIIDPTRALARADQLADTADTSGELWYALTAEAWLRDHHG